MNQMLSIKVKINDECRRYQVQSGIEFREFIDSISRCFKKEIKLGTCTLKYKDDENEWITFDTPSEFEDAKETVLKMKNGVLFVKISENVDKQQVPKETQKSETILLSPNLTMPPEHSQPPKLPEYSAEFIQDVTIEDGTKVIFGKRFQKIWR